MRILSVSYPVPYTCQFASPELVWDFINGGRDLKTDPNWAAYGASSPQEYAYWAMRSCGVVCVKMAVEGITGRPTGTVMDWVHAGLAIDGYLTELRPDRLDKPVEKGWKHLTLARLAIERGCYAELAAELHVNSLVAQLQNDRLVVASVSSELGEQKPLTRNSGHLIVVHGVMLGGDGQVSEVVVHNPSGRTAALRESAHIPTGRFAQGFSGRGIIIGPTN